jgi:PPOX class probable F420-dependent enzyme
LVATHALWGDVREAHGFCYGLYRNHFAIQRRGMTTLRPEQRALLEEKLFGTLATVDGKGTPMQVLVWYMLRDDEVLVASMDTAQKVKNIQRTGWASLTVSQGPRYVAVRGHATLDHDLARVRADYAIIVRRYLPPEAAEQWLADRADQMDSRLVIHIPIEHVVPKEGMPGS